MLCTAHKYSAHRETICSVSVSPSSGLPQALARHLNSLSSDQTLELQSTLPQGTVSDDRFTLQIVWMHPVAQIHPLKRNSLDYLM